jgi:hypothetical protein
MQKLWQDSEIRGWMVMFYKISPINETDGKVFIPAKLTSEHVFVNTDPVVISVGQRHQSVKVSVKHDLMEDEIMLSQDVIDSLMFPIDIKYQLKFDNHSIKLGPIVGLLMVKGFDSSFKRKLKDFLTYCLIYPEIHGLVMVISEEDIDFEKRLVKGYYYNSDLKETIIPWKEGIFPLPDSIFVRKYLFEDIRFKLKKATNNSMFNSKYYNKWEFWNLVSKFEAFCEFIPETCKLYSVDDIDHMLSRYGSAYIKPINGTLSRGLFKVTAENGIYDVKDKLGQKVKNSTSRKGLQEFLEDILQRHEYLVQRALKPMGVDDRHLDFRVVMQKDNSMMWNCTTIVAFVGNPGDICSNWGYTAKFEDLLGEHFQFNQQEIYLKKQEIIAACRTICEILDLTGENYGDLGFDVIIDESLKVWILETNTRHYHSIPLWNGDAEAFYEIKTNPIRYAVALSGFKVY